MTFTPEPHDVRSLSFYGANIGEALRNAGAWCADKNLDQMTVYGINAEEVPTDGTYIDIFYLPEEIRVAQLPRRRQ